jgi:hypothetical protein
MFSHDTVDNAFRRLDAFLHRTFGDATHSYHRKTRLNSDGKVEEIPKEVVKEPVQRAHVHWQNLTDEGEVEGQERFPPYNGRCWLSVYRDVDHTNPDSRKKRQRDKAVGIHLEWNLGKSTTLLGANVDVHPWNDSDVTFSLGVWPLSLWLGVEGIAPLFDDWWKKTYEYGSRSFGAKIFLNKDGHLPELYFQWDLWKDQNDWRSDSPDNWKTGMVELLRTVFGERTRIERTIISEKAVKIPMPEGNYDATLSMIELLSTRKRWPGFVISRHADFDIPGGIPHEGKRGDGDALYGLSCPARNEDDAIAEVVATVTKSRLRYDRRGTVYPTPEERKAMLEERMAKRTKEDDDAFEMAPAEG